MKVIGLCGQSGAGKGLVCSFFSELNVACIDTDKVYHDIISTDSACTLELLECFGHGIYANPGINRKELGKIVFNSPEGLKQLNTIAHKHILNSVRETISRIKKDGIFDGVIIDAPLLFESGFDKECDVTLALLADKEVKIARIMARDSIDREHALKRLESQISNEDLKKKCDYAIENNSNAQELREKVGNIKKIIFD